MKNLTIALLCVLFATLCSCHHHHHHRHEKETIRVLPPSAHHQYGKPAPHKPGKPGVPPKPRY